MLRDKMEGLHAGISERPDVMPSVAIPPELRCGKSLLERDVFDKGKPVWDKLRGTIYEATIETREIVYQVVGAPPRRGVAPFAFFTAAELRDGKEVSTGGSNGGAATDDRGSRPAKKAKAAAEEWDAFAEIFRSDTVRQMHHRGWEATITAVGDGRDEAPTLHIGPWRMCSSSSSSSSSRAASSRKTAGKGGSGSSSSSSSSRAASSRKTAGKGGSGSSSTSSSRRAASSRKTAGKGGSHA